MEPARFDRLAKIVSRSFASGTRRSLLGLIAALPLAGARIALDAEESEGRRKGHNRRQHHRRQSGRRKENRKGKRKGHDKLGASATCRSLDQLCSIVSGPSCCSGASCEATLGVFITTCQRGCQTSFQCQEWFPGMDVECVKDAVACPGHPSGCCRPKQCTPDRSIQRGLATIYNSRDTATCTHSNGVCCGPYGATGGHHCCLPGQVCSAGEGCVDPDLLLDSASRCKACTKGVCCSSYRFGSGCCPLDKFCIEDITDTEHWGCFAS
jgi:hypothetical protein